MAGPPTGGGWLADLYKHAQSEAGVKGEETARSQGTGKPTAQTMHARIGFCVGNPTRRARKNPAEAGLSLLVSSERTEHGGPDSSI